MSKAIHIAVKHIATLMHIAPINMFEDPCAIHISYSLCRLIVGAMHFDCENMIVFNTFKYVLSCLMYCFGQYVLNRLL